jgi:hypothetical protein
MSMSFFEFALADQEFVLLLELYRTKRGRSKAIANEHVTKRLERLWFIWSAAAEAA